MDKTKRIGLFLLLGTLLAASFGVYAMDKEKAVEHIEPVVLSKAQGLAWVQQCVAQYPEILWLADAQVRKTEEGVASAKSPYSEQLFGKPFIEFDRTIMTLRCLQLTLDGSDAAYREFTAAQPENAKLSKKSFDELHAKGMALLHSNEREMAASEMIQAMEAALVLGDIGKSEQARKLFKPYGAQAPDHDDFHGEVMQILKEHPELCPTFNRLSPRAKELLCESANLAHYGHITHLEGGKSMFSTLKQSGLPSTDPVAVRFDLFVHTCDVQGALGHVNNQSSLVYTESTHQAMQAVAQAIDVLADAQKTEMDAYNAYLTVRAHWLGLNPQDRLDRVLTRIGTMLRLFSLEEGQLLKNGIQQLDPKEQAKVIAQLDSEEKDELLRTPTYMPAVLVNLLNNPQLGSSKEERLSKTLELGLPFLARVLEKHKQSIAEKKADPEIPLNFNRAAGVAKTEPTRLQKSFMIDSEGNVNF